MTELLDKLVFIMVNFVEMSSYRNLFTAETSMISLPEDIIGSN